MQLLGHFYSCISNDIKSFWVKQKQLQTNTIKVYKRNIKQVIPIKKLKSKSFALDKSIQDNLDLILVSNLSIKYIFANI